MSESADNREERLFELVADYLEVAETGATPDASTILAGRADLAPDLAEFIASLHEVGRHTSPLRQVIEQKHDPSLPPSFGDFELLGVIGRGGMGVVYRARQVSLNRIVALKMIRSTLFDKVTSTRRFRAEAEATARLDHPGIAPIYEIGEYEEHPYFSMKLLDGGNLAEHIPTLKQSPRRVAELMSAIARAVHHAHERGILHRDLKPSNILLDTDGRPYVADFGLARWLDAEGGLTQTGMMVGTPAYMAPELVTSSHTTNRREAVTTASDTYGLGAVLYAALTGKPPFQGVTPMATLSDVCEREPVSPAALNPLVDRDLATICLKCLQKSPQKRYSSAASVADDLDRWLNRLPIHARPIGASERFWRWCGRNRLLAAISGSAAMLVVVAVIALASGYFLVNEARETADTHRREAEQTSDSLRQRLYVAQMGRAMTQFERGYYDELGAALAEFAPYPGLQGFEFRWLSAEFDARPLELVRYEEHEGIIYGSAISPDGRTIATCGEDRSIHLWDAETGARRRVLRPHPETASLPVKGHKEDENRVGFSPDGHHLVSGGEDGSVRLWNLETGEWRSLNPGHHGEVLVLAFAPDGRWIISAGNDRIVRVWDAREGSPAGEFRGHSAPVRAAAISRDGQFAVSVDGSGAVRGWDIETRELKFAMNSDDALYCIAIAPDGRWIAAAGASSDVFAWSIPEGVRIPLAVRDVGPIQSLDISPDGNMLAVCGNDACVRIRSKGDEPLHQFRAHESRMWSVRFLSDGQRLLTVSADRTAKIWRIPSTHRRRYWHLAETSPIRHLTLAPRGTSFTFTTMSGVIQMGDVETRGPLTTLTTSTKGNTFPAYAPDGLEVAFVDQSGTIHRWSTVENRELHPTFTPTPDRSGVPGDPDVLRLAYMLDGRLVALRMDGQLWISDGDRWQTQRVSLAEPTLNDLLPNMAHGPLLAIADIGHARIVHWDLARGLIAGDVTTPPFSTTACALAPDRNAVACGDSYGNVRILELQSGRELARMVGHRGSVNSLAFAPDGRTLVSTGADGTVRLWNLLTREELFVIEADPDHLCRAAGFSGDGRFLLVARSSDSRNSISVYDSGTTGLQPADDPKEN